MKNMLLALFFSLSFIASASASHVSKCDVVGSYIQIQGSTPDDAVLNQLQLNVGGTAYWWQSPALSLPITEGTFSPAIGTWELRKDTIIVTLIGFDAAPAGDIEGCCDINQADWYRNTFQLRVIDKNTLESDIRVSRSFSFTEDPVEASGTVTSSGTTPRTYKKVHVVPSDLVP